MKTTLSIFCMILVLGFSVNTVFAEEGTEEPSICGGIAGIKCAKREFCEFPAGECGVADLQGVCTTTQDVCLQDYIPVCGCDGKTYGNDCMRKSAGMQKAHDGACDEPTER